MKESYIHDLPENRGVENGLKRALQMTEIRWSPLRYMAGSQFYYTRDENGEFAGQYVPFYFSPALPNTGMVYSSVLKNQKFLGYNVSLETYMTALSDPVSVLYEKNLHGSGRRNVGCWYGIVCSCFASYVHDLPTRTICREWPKVKNVTKLGQPELDELKLLDVILNVRKHIAVITDIQRDAAGRVRLVEVSEAVLPRCRRSYFLPEEFRAYWYGRDFEIYRKADTEGITYTPSPFVRVEADPARGISADPELPDYVYNRDIMPNQGNASNYVGSEAVCIDILSEGWEKLRVEREGGADAVYDIGGSRVELTEKEPGYYTARAVRADGTESAPACWALTGIDFRADKALYRPGEKMVFTYGGQGSDDVFLLSVNRLKTSGEVKGGFLSEREKAARTVETDAPQEQGEFFAFVSAKNKYGVYASGYAFFRVE